MGQLPNEDVGDDAFWVPWEQAVRAQTEPATDAEAVAVLDVLPAGEDSSYTLAWHLLQFVESAPGWPRPDSSGRPVCVGGVPPRTCGARAHLGVDRCAENGVQAPGSTATIGACHPSGLVPPCGELMSYSVAPEPRMHRQTRSCRAWLRTSAAVPRRTMKRSSATSSPPIATTCHPRRDPSESPFGCGRTPSESRYRSGSMPSRPPRKRSLGTPCLCGTCASFRAQP
jgi:hypothetical protein